MDRRFRFVLAQTAWMLFVVLALELLNSLTVSLYFILSYIGLLVVIELTAPFAVVPTWRPRLRWLVLLGLSVFGYLALRRIDDILPPGVF
jgi:hypothetical protein